MAAASSPQLPDLVPPVPGLDSRRDTSNRPPGRNLSGCGQLGTAAVHHDDSQEFDSDELESAVSSLDPVPSPFNPDTRPSDIHNLETLTIAAQKVIDHVEHASHRTGHLSPGTVSSSPSTESSSPRIGSSSPNTGPSSSTSSLIMTPRAYQLEMLEESMKRNVIVAMDTGTGKTQVAVLRIKQELDRAAPEKLVWFLAPTVALCAQQFEVIKSQIPEVQAKLLTGDSNLETWSEQRVWDAFLLNVRVVVSTFQVLYDALAHAYVPMSSLALIVFDEAHNCVSKHPGRKIMMDFYHPSRLVGDPVPHILGLTASPVFGSKLEGMEALEETLHAICKSPFMHRDEFIATAKQPKMVQVTYTVPELVPVTEAIKSLETVYQTMKHEEDPYILSLGPIGSERSRRALKEADKNHNTRCSRQMKSFCRNALEICRELGPWAADYYIAQVAIKARNSLESAEVLQYSKWLEVEKQYIADLLAKVDAPQPKAGDFSLESASEKFRILVEQLLPQDGGTGDNLGIVFVCERNVVAILAHMLPLIPEIRHKYRVGTATACGKREPWDLSKGIDIEALGEFKSRKVNLLIATSVLEEGIDVSACNLVVCFDAPKNLKSFIQRRGRARMRDSRLAILVDAGTGLRRQWQDLEDEMKRRYQDKEREHYRLQQIEESEPGSAEYFVVKSTGARLDHDNAKQHLEHFCKTLSRGEYIDSRPDYITHPRMNSLGGIDTLTCDVILPAYVPPDVRKAVSVGTWDSEKNAMKDAAFQAYVALYHAGLVNEHLLPFKPEDILPGLQLEEGVVLARPRHDPWPKVARAWEQGHPLWSYSIRLLDDASIPQGDYEMVLPVELPQMQPICMYMDHATTWAVEFGPATPVSRFSDQVRDHTSTLLALHFSHRWTAQMKPHVARFAAKQDHLSLDMLGATEFSLDQANEGFPFLVRDESGCPFIYRGVISEKPRADLVQRPFYKFEDAPSDVPYLVLKKWPRRADFLHPLTRERHTPQEAAKPYGRVYPVPMARVDSVPMVHARFGSFIPSILHEVETYLVAQTLSSTILKPLGIPSLELVLTAISARSAAEPRDYERLEFLGDSLLKFLVTVNAACQHPKWPAYFLSIFKERLVANARLCRATQDAELDRFILSKAFTGHKWQPLYVDEVIQRDSTSDDDRPMASKTLADVVEALMGASFVHGGVDAAVACISLLVEDIDWMKPASARLSLYAAAPQDVALPPALIPLEKIANHTFTKKSLLVDAMTHASYRTGNQGGCLERLEFVGDAILEYIVVSELFNIKPSLPNQKLHLLKTALVNHEIIAFFSMEFSAEEDTADIVVKNASSAGSSSENQAQVDIVKSRFSRPLWHFMRHTQPAIAAEQKATRRRHQALRDEIITALRYGTHYPWATLARLQARKFYSDIFESLLGALWVDSGDLQLCTQLVERFGILPYMRRILEDGVHALHPKEELSQLAGSKTVNYVIDVNEVKVDAGDEEVELGWGPVIDEKAMEFLCKVIVGDVCVAEVRGGVSREEVKTKAAEEAVRVMKASGSAGNTGE